MNRRTFAKCLLAAPAVASSAGRRAMAGMLDNEVDALLRDEPFFDCAASDRFYYFPHEKARVFNPAKILPVAGGAVLGIGHLTPEYSIAPTMELELSKPGEVTHRSAYDGPGNVQHILREFECLHRAVEAHADKAALVLSAEEMAAARKAGKLALVAGLDTGTETNGDPLVLGELYRLGLRKMAMVHEAPTPFSGSDSSDPRTGPGLNPLGREMVAECNRLGIMVDVSHSNDRTFWGVIEATRRPVIATHSGARKRAFTRRNLSDGQIRAIVKNGGMIGVGAMLNPGAWKALWDAGFYTAEIRVAKLMEQTYPDRMERAEAFRDPAKMAAAEKAAGFPHGLPGKELESTLMDPESTLQHLDYLTALIGFDHVGIGTDLELTSAQYAVQVRGIAAGMIRRKYSQDQIRKIFRTNLLRTFRENERTA